MNDKHLCEKIMLRPVLDPDIFLLSVFLNHQYSNHQVEQVVNKTPSNPCSNHLQSIMALLGCMGVMLHSLSPSSLKIYQSFSVLLLAVS